jgi:hypothetical protein
MVRKASASAALTGDCCVDVRLGDVGDEVAAAVGAEGLGLQAVVQHAVLPHVDGLLQVEAAGEPQAGELS